MNQFLLTMIALALLFAAEGRAQSKAIHEGKKVAPSAFPFMVAVIDPTSKPGEEFEGHLCGGSLVQPTWVLTAAHCVMPNGEGHAAQNSRAGSSDQSPCQPSREYDVYSGSSDFRGGDRIKVVEVCAFEPYDAATHSNDLALLRLERKPKSSVTWATVALLDPAQDGTLVKEGTDATLIGWREGGPRELLETSLKVVERASCDQRIREYNRNEFDKELHEGLGLTLPDRLKSMGFPVQRQDEVFAKIVQTVMSVMGNRIEPGMICAGEKTGLKNHCRGDSGGPLLVKEPSGKWVQIGIVSWGEDCRGEPIPPGVYTRVSHYSDWIKGHLK